MRRQAVIRLEFLPCRPPKAGKPRYLLRRGFTLIEVLATLVLVALVLPVVMQGISLATGLAGLSRQRTEACLLAQSKLNELALAGAWRRGELAGDFGADWPGYRWSASVRDWDAEIQELTVQVTWERRGRSYSLALSTLIPSGTTP